MKKPSNRRERIAFICQKKGRRVSDWFTLMTDKEVKIFFENMYPSIKDSLDATNADEEVQCIRCGCNVEHHLECAFGYDRAVFSEEDWKRDIEDNSLSELRDTDREFVTNGYHVN